MTGNEFADAWPGALTRIEFLTPKPLLPAAAISFLSSTGLPSTFSITGSQLVTFTTNSDAVHLSNTWAQQMREWSMPTDWSRFWHFGDITYTQASAWLCVEEVSGRIVAIDVEIDNPVYPVASSVMNLASSMLFWLHWYSETNGKIGAINDLRRAFRDDPEFTSEEFDWFWGALLESECDSGIDRFHVSDA